MDFIIAYILMTILYIAENVLLNISYKIVRCVDHNFQNNYK